MKMIMLLALLMMAGCSYTGKELTFANTLSIPSNVFPSGWNVVSTQHEPDWGSYNTFLTQYSHPNNYLNLIYWFVYYDNIESSSEFSSKYGGGVFHAGIKGNVKWQSMSDRFILDTQNYDSYDLRCKDLLKNGVSLQQCASQLQYNHCIIILSSNVDDMDMTLPDFVNILNYVDSKMPEVDICNS